MYSWADVAARTAEVYNMAATSTRDDSLVACLQRYVECGAWAGRAFALVAVIGHLYLRWLQWAWPAQDVELAPDWPHQLTGNG